MEAKGLQHRRELYRQIGRVSLTGEEVHQLLGAVDDVRDKALLELAISTGIRREDLVRVRRRDVDDQRLMVSYYESKKKRMWSAHVPLVVLNALLMYIKVSDGPYLFPGRSGGGHLSGRKAYNILQEYLDRAGLPRRPFHALRSTCVKLCQAKGWTIQQTSEHIGDSQRVIEDHYAVASVGEMAEIAKEKPLL